LTLIFTNYEGGRQTEGKARKSKKETKKERKKEEEEIC
jgi:hypothetical protein